MFGKRFGHDQDAAARPKDGGTLRTVVGIGGKSAVELMQPRDGGRAVSLREGRERRVELGGPKARGHAAKVNDLSTDRQRPHQSRPLQGLGFVRQGEFRHQFRQPQVHREIGLDGREPLRLDRKRQHARG